MKARFNPSIIDSSKLVGRERLRHTYKINAPNHKPMPTNKRKVDTQYVKALRMFDKMNEGYDDLTKEVWDE